MIPDKIESGKFILHKLAELFHRSIDYKQKTKALFRLFSLFWEELTRDEKLTFTTLFVRLTYAASTYPLQGTTLFMCHRFRRIMESGSVTEKEAKEIFELGLVALRNAVEECLHLHSDDENVINAKVNPNFAQKKYTVKKFYTDLRIVITSVNVEKFTIDFVSEEEGETTRTAYFDVEQKNELFNSIITTIPKLYNLPIIANLIDVEVDERNRHIPGAIVLLPDFLLDATSIAKLFSSFGVNEIGYLISKFIPTEANDYLLMGNIANHFLDTLLYAPDLSFNEIRKNIFALSPLQVAQFSDEKVNSILRDAHNHYQNIRECISSEFLDQNIERKNAYVEPSFLSNTTGFQGRLDLLHINESKGQVDIVELKSGKPFMANANGVNEAHYRQLMIYEMMIRNLGPKKIRPKNYILYSKLKHNRLRYAGYGRVHQYEIIKYRNIALFFEQLLLNAPKLKDDFFEKFNPDRISDNFRFEKRDARKLYVAYKSLETLEKTYVNEFIKFITKEYHLAKIGEHGIDKSNGLAGLWLDPVDEKIEEFRVLSKLVIDVNNSAQKNPTLELLYSEYSNTLSRFRVGDIVIFYPDTIKNYSTVDSQLFKASIIEINDHKIIIRLRASQMNNGMFHEFKYWNLEPDFLDRSITNMYQNLYQFMLLDVSVRQKIMGRRAPKKSTAKEHVQIENLSQEQNQILNEIISAKDYYLLWGPPGTGKTSVIIKNLIKYYYESKNDNILLLAYTNRAVDEMCEALHAIGGDIENSYLRLGSRYSIHKKYKASVLSSLLEDIESRAELNDLIKSKRIFFSTVSSIHANRELFNVKEFSTVIIDEASQLLEPYVINLLGQFEKFILIGDHKQLPAVVKQKNEDSILQNRTLATIGLENLKNSLFERLYKQTIKNQWHWAKGTLTQQGRMHEKIMTFVSENYYDNKLSSFSNVDRLIDPLPPYEHPILSDRILFINTPIDETLTSKVNRFEADLVLKLYEIISQSLTQKFGEGHTKTIGIITPFRAQIATITQCFHKAKIDMDRITIDTVERYQGGARDFIILSLTTNDRSVLGMISNKSDEGFDRKLNVAITRAKEQIIILGNKEILAQDASYKTLIEYSTEIDSEKL